jgi:hypothetical protein
VHIDIGSIVDVNIFFYKFFKIDVRQSKGKTTYFKTDGVFIFIDMITLKRMPLVGYG